MLNNKYNDLIKRHENAWTLSYLFPEMYAGGKIPEEHPAPSNTTALTMDRTVLSYQGNYIGVFSPVVETCAPYFGTYQANGSLPVGNLDHYVVYADNNGAALNMDNNNILASLNTWNYKQGPYISRLSAYRRLRVVGASMEIIVNDRATDYTGIIETCTGFEVIGNGFKNDSIDATKLQNYVDYRTYKTNKHVIVKYRYTNEKYTRYGPYEPFSTVPFYLVKISGMSPTASVTIKTIVHVEGVLMPSLVHFATKDLIPQASFLDQQKEMEKKVSSATSTKEQATNEHNNVTNDMFSPNDLPSANKVYANKKKSKIEVSEILTKREAPEVINLNANIPLPAKPSSIYRKTKDSVLSYVSDTVNSLTASDFIDIISPDQNKVTPNLETNQVKPGRNIFALPPADPTFKQKSSNKKSEPMEAIMPISSNNKMGTINQRNIDKSITAIDNTPEDSKMVDEFVTNQTTKEKPSYTITSDQYLAAFRTRVSIPDDVAEKLKVFSLGELQMLEEMYRSNPERIRELVGNVSKDNPIKPSNAYEIPVNGDL